MLPTGKKKNKPSSPVTVSFLVHPIEPQTLTSPSPPASGGTRMVRRRRPLFSLAGDADAVAVGNAAALTNPPSVFAEGEGPPRPGRTREVRQRAAGRRATVPPRRARRWGPVRLATASGIGLGRGAAVAAPVGGRPGARRHGVRPVGAVPPVRRRRGNRPRPGAELRVRELPAGRGRGGRSARAAGGPRRRGSR